MSSLQFSSNEVLKDLIEITEGDLDLKEKCNILIDIYKRDRSNYYNYSQSMPNFYSIHNENLDQLEKKKKKNSTRNKKTTSQKKLILVLDTSHLFRKKVIV